jgi:chromosome segregation ATPase
MEKNITKSGLSIHCHHNILVEHCYNYDERVEVIKRDKPQNEQEIRLRLFKLLPKEAVDELPAEWKKAVAERDKAYAEWEKADAEWEKADAEWEKASAEWKKAYAEWEKADAEWEKADAEWKKADQEIWHKKWCGCAHWNGDEIVFKED